MWNNEVSPPLSRPVVCCMCGDHGLPQELFRCKACVVRYQHKYCSNLYPKVESYRSCDWCLRNDAGNVTGQESTEDACNSVTPSKINSDNSSSRGRGSFPPHLKREVKKQKVNECSSPNRNDRMRSEEISPRLGRGKQFYRGKVKRFKLLEEVSS